MFYGLWVYFMNISYIFVHLVHFFQFGYYVQRKIWQPWLYVKAEDPNLQKFLAKKLKNFAHKGSVQFQSN
jgi:hypothetical protein